MKYMLEIQHQISKIFLFSAIILCSLSCDLLNSKVDKKVDPREFIWEADTLHYKDSYQTIMTRLWGTSKCNLFAVGHCSRVLGTMWQLVGDNWSPSILGVSIGGQIEGYHGIVAVDGISQNEVWAVGYHKPTGYEVDSALVIHYGGVEWSQVTTPSGLSLTEVLVISDDDVWFGGEYGTLFHYNGEDISNYKIPLPAEYYTDLFGYFKSIEGVKSNDIYALYYCVEGDNDSYLLHFDGEDWTIKDNFYYTSLRRLWMSPAGILYCAGDKNVFQWKNGSWETILNDFEYTFIAIGGSSDSDMIIGGYNAVENHGDIRHYNGNDWYSYPISFNYSRYMYDVWYENGVAYLLNRTNDQGKTSTIVLKGS